MGPFERFEIETHVNSLKGLVGVTALAALGLPDRGPEGRILVVATRTGPVGFLVDEVVRVPRYDRPHARPRRAAPAGR
jgi:chemotaxis signal transduction protein